MRNSIMKNSKLVFDKFRVNKIENLEKIKGGRMIKPHITIDKPCFK